ncbi:MAG: hypothetical protein ACYCYH_15245, partial [Steroidobacteraceae bacterium]
QEISMPQNCGTWERPPGLKERLVNQCAVEIQASNAKSAEATVRHALRTRRYPEDGRRTKGKGGR